MISVLEIVPTSIFIWKCSLYRREKWNNFNSNSVHFFLQQFQKPSRNYENLKVNNNKKIVVRFSILFTLGKLSYLQIDTLCRNCASFGYFLRIFHLEKFGSCVWSSNKVNNFPPITICQKSTERRICHLRKENLASLERKTNPHWTSKFYTLMQFIIKEVFGLSWIFVFSFRYDEMRREIQNIVCWG